MQVEKKKRILFERNRKPNPFIEDVDCQVVDAISNEWTYRRASSRCACFRNLELEMLRGRSPAIIISFPLRFSWFCRSTICEKYNTYRLVDYITGAFQYERYIVYFCTQDISLQPPSVDLAHQMRTELNANNVQDAEVHGDWLHREVCLEVTSFPVDVKFHNYQINIRPNYRYIYYRLLSRNTKNRTIECKHSPLLCVYSKCSLPCITDHLKNMDPRLTWFSDLEIFICYLSVSPFKW